MIEPLIGLIDQQSYLSQDWLNELRTLGEVVVHNDRPDEAEVRRRLKAVDVAVVEWSPVPASVFLDGVCVKHIVTPTTGFKQIDVCAAAAAGVIVSNTPDYCRQSVAEYAITVSLMLAKNVEAAKFSVDADLRSDYTALEPGLELFRKRLGVIGMGGIGTWVAKIAQGFDMEVLAYNRSKVRMPGVRQCDLSEVVQMSDLIICCLPATETTKGIVTSEMLRLCKRGLIVTSISGPHVFDISTLMGLLRSGHVRAVGIDSQVDERLEPLPNLVQTPDCAWYTADALTNSARTVLDTIRGGLEGHFDNGVNLHMLKTG